MEGADLRRAMDMLLSERLEEQFRQLHAGTLLSELRSAVSLPYTDSNVSKGTNLKLMLCAESLAVPLRELLEAVLVTQIRAEEWYRAPVVFYRYLVFRSAAIRDLREFLGKFTYLAKQEHRPTDFVERYIDDSSSGSVGDHARNRGALREPMVGRSELQDRIVSILLADGAAGDDGPLVIPVVGGPGVGKTRLSKAVMRNVRIKHKFGIRHVLPFGQDFNLREILLAAFPGKTLQDFGDVVEDMNSYVASKLRGGHYLIVLDDVWSDNDGTWLQIGNLIKALPSNGRVVLTTRTPDIVAKLGTVIEISDTRLFYLEPLDQEFSYALVAAWIAKCHCDWPSELIAEAGMRIADKCGGVPLLLDYACRFFFQPLDMQFWQGFLGNPADKQIHPDMFWQELLACIYDLPHGKFWKRFLGHSPKLSSVNGIFESASLSYKHLPPDLRDCLLYCSMFPSDYDFDVEELADLLAAEGFIPPMVAKALRKRFLKQLLEECFYPLQEHEYGNKSTYRMHKVLHIYLQNLYHVLTPIVRVDLEAQVTTKAEAHSTFQRTWLIVNRLTARFSRRFFACEELGTLMLIQEGPMDAPDLPQCEITDVPQSILKSLKHIHALSLRAANIRMLPTKFLHPNHVRYLNLSQTDIEDIPSSISRLAYLQTLILSYCNKLQKLHPNTTKLTLLQKLDLAGCCNLVELPRDMSKLKSLEYLDISECSLLTQLPHDMGKLKSLQILFGYIVSNDDGNSISELQSLENLCRLSLQSLEKVLDLSDVRYARLQHKTKLESLSLRWNTDDLNSSESAYDVLESLQPHRRLKALEIVAYEGKKLPSWITTTWMATTKPYLKSLVEIKLINLKSCENELPPLGLLPCLKIAEISGPETICSINENFYGHDGIFPSLKILTFSYMPNLEVWEQVHRPGMFPCLTELAIIQCPKFRALHIELLSLKKLVLWMSNKVLYGLNGALRGVARNLEHVSISFSEELLASSDCQSLWDLGKLRNLEICGCDEMSCLPQSLQYISSIRSLTIDNCSKLKVLPVWLESLSSLQIIRLSCCPMLHHIPGGLQQRPGLIIYVEDCPNLLEQQVTSFPQSSGISIAICYFKLCLVNEYSVQLNSDDHMEECIPP